MLGGDLYATNNTSHTRLVLLYIYRSCCTKAIFMVYKSPLIFYNISMLSKTQGAGEAHRPRPELRRKAQKKRGFF
ncbi:hypothetical protein Hanom_Chr09g00830971 [Helianthus anomalus]